MANFFWICLYTISFLQRTSQSSLPPVACNYNRQSLEFHNICATFRKISCGRFDIILTVFFHPLQRFIGPLLLSNATVLSTLLDISPGFHYFHLTIAFLLLCTSSAQLLRRLHNNAVIWRLRPYLDICR